MKFTATVLIFVGLTLLGVASMSIAKIKQTSELIKLPEVEIIDASLHEFSINDYFKLNVDKVALEREGGVKNMRFRVFAGTIDELASLDLRKRDKYNCILYSSKSFMPEEYNGGLRFTFPFGYNWLGVNNNDLESQTYVIVFEERNNSSDILRLHPDQVAAYFSQGFQFIVKRPNSLDEKTRREYVKKKEERLVKVRKAIEDGTKSAEIKPECNMLIAANLLQQLKLASFCEAADSTSQSS